MKPPNRLLLITLWEFKRWFKLGDKLRAVVISALLGALFWALFLWAQKSVSAVASVVVLGAPPFQAELVLPAGWQRLADDGRGGEAWLASLATGEVDAVLDFEAPERVTLTRLEGSEEGSEELVEALNDGYREHRLKALDLPADQLAGVLAPLPVTLGFQPPAAGARTLADKIAAGLWISLMLLGVLTGLTYQFIVITGEKRLRVTEQIVAAVSPQTWIDGKILGITLLSFSSVLTYVGASLAFFLVSRFFGQGVALPAGVFDPLLWLALSALCLLGYFFWNTFFAAVAATINDPHTSSRGVLMLLPLLPLAFAYLALQDPSSTLIRILSVFPLTSPTVLSARLVLASVPLWEILLAVVLLLLAIAVLRRLAGKVFALSILLHGREPGWGEMLAWMRRV